MCKEETKMTVKDVINRIHDVDMAIDHVEDETHPLTESDREHICMFLEDYKECLLSRAVSGTVNK